MSISHPVATRNEVVDLIVDKVDVGTANAQGRLQIIDASANVLVTLNMTDPAFGASASGIATADTISDGTCAIAGTAATFTVIDKDETAIFSGTAGALGSGADLEADGLTLAMTVGQTISIDALTYQGPN